MITGPRRNERVDCRRRFSKILVLKRVSGGRRKSLINVANPRTRLAGSQRRSKAGVERFADEVAPIHRMSILVFTWAVKRLNERKSRQHPWYISE